jgi:hypothetical protein
MAKVILYLMVVLSVARLGTVMVESTPSKVLAEFPGSSLKWIRVAEPVFIRESLDLDKYTIGVIDYGETVVVSVTILRNDVELRRGHPPAPPGYEVEISKKDMKVVRSNYIR